MKLYVGNLPFSVTQETLKEAFSKFGNVEEATIIVDKFSNRSKGFGFVTFSDGESGKKAIAEMNDKEFEGRSLKVSEAKPIDENQERRPPRRNFNDNRRFNNRGFNNRRN